MFRLCAIWFGVLATSLQATAPVTPEQQTFFESKVRPLLIEHCYECHSADKQKGGLRVDGRAAMLDGGESGPAVVPGVPEQSLLLQAIRYENLEMPPKGQLPDEKVAILEQWIRAGAPWPDDTSSARRDHRTDAEQITKEEREHWAFRPVVEPVVPEGVPGERTRHPIDRFIAQRLDAAGIAPNPRATDRELIRRVYFDLTGLPPTFAEMQRWLERFTSDATVAQQGSAGTAYRELIDELLARPAYAEHWARHWLDVVRYAQSNGYERDGYKPYAWRYRDYVVDAFLHDKPYDRFVLEQLAGDELPDADSMSRIATGFYRLGVWDDEPDDKRQAEFDEMDDIMVAVGSSFLGLTVGCARCHEHKFDPIPQADYYRLLAHFRNVRPFTNPEPRIDNATAFPLAANEEIRHRYSLFRDSSQSSAPSSEAAPSGTSSDGTAGDGGESPENGQPKRMEPGLDFTEWALVVREHEGAPAPTHVLVRGNAATPGTEVQPGFLRVLESESETCRQTSPTTSEENLAPADRAPLADLFPTCGRRLQLARWLVRPDHPLTARVLVNRVWHYHFGRGIVATTSDFGRAGSAPSHPELLDWLASQFIKSGWSIKALHRMILESEAYQRSSHWPSDPQTLTLIHAKDAANTLLWRQNLRRLEAESVRDSILAASGQLRASVGGVEMYPSLSGEVLAGQSRPGLGWDVSSPDDQRRRSLYAIVKRGVRDPLLEAFDYSNVTSPLNERPTTTVAPQALMLLNGRFTAEQASALVDQLEAVSSDQTVRIDHLFQHTLQRFPTDNERTLMRDALERAEREYRDLAEQVVFRCDVPVSLYGEYRRRLPGNAFLIGPKSGWEYRGGVWGGGYEGIEVVDKSWGPHAFWRDCSFRDGRLTGRVHLDQSVELLSFVLRADAQGDHWRGVTIRLNPVAKRLEVAHSHTEPAQFVPMMLPSDQWLSFRLELQGRTLRVECVPPGTPSATHTFNLPESTDAVGCVGVAVWGGSVVFDRTMVEVGEQRHEFAPSMRESRTAETWARRMAWESLGRLMFNLNEFVYVD